MNWIPFLTLGAILMYAAFSMADEDQPFDYERALVPYEKLTAEQKTQILAGKSVRFPINSGHFEGAQAFALVEVSMPVVWDGLKNYELLDTWMHGVKSNTGITWTSPLTAEAHYIIKSPFKDVQYVLRRTHLSPDTIRWTRISGDLEQIYGGYDLIPTEDGKTILLYGSFVDFGFWVPERIKRFFTIKGLSKLMESIQYRFGGNWSPEKPRRDD